jgi:hypothetical protein
VLVYYFLTAQGLSRRHGADYFRETISRIFSALRDDPAVRPALEKSWHEIQANIHFLVAREFYRDRNLKAARAELRRYLMDLPFTQNLKSALLMFIFPVSIQQSFRKLKAKLRMSIGAVCMRAVLKSKKRSE